MQGVHDFNQLSTQEKHYVIKRNFTSKRRLDVKKEFRTKHVSWAMSPVTQFT